MLEPMHIFDERATTNILTEEMHSLYLFSFLLTADNDIAEQCYVCGLGECVEGISVFMDWARSWARRTILKHAIRMIMPAPEHTDNLSLISLKGAATLGKNSLFAAHCRTQCFRTFCLRHVSSRKAVRRRLLDASNMLAAGCHDWGSLRIRTLKQRLGVRASIRSMTYNRAHRTMEVQNGGVNKLSIFRKRCCLPYFMIRILKRPHDCPRVGTQASCKH